ncbi:fatty acid hydroxylase [Marinicauda salina]|uniref:Fatty acid hydroxylase n=1 Tax=Marinicauda salina TaxID=2135793 RepID=A0A2U2BTP9_9PROT|nr:sterol desaturase family protein [Marinicauda salina]PWE17381.1 fatty acid hydroxylase [Marinicauda salina]
MVFVYLLTFGLFVLLFTREVIAPASGASCDKRWRLFAGAINILNIVVVLTAGVIFSGWIDANSLVTLPPRFGVIGTSFAVFLTAGFVTYWWHRLMHASDTIWRMVHQLHHSPSRVETLTAFYVHPLDSFAAAFLNAVVAYWILGASAWATGLAFFYVSVFNLIAHADMRTPYWLGFFLQRPEMHRIHHERGAHRNNYGLPIFDMLFGTWCNPTGAPVACGFSEPNEYRVRDMLLMRDVGE